MGNTCRVQRSEWRLIPFLVYIYDWIVHISIEYFIQISRYNVVKNNFRSLKITKIYISIPILMYIEMLLLMIKHHFISISCLTINDTLSIWFYRPPPSAKLNSTNFNIEHSHIFVGNNTRFYEAQKKNHKTLVTRLCLIFVSCDSQKISPVKVMFFAQDRLHHQLLDLRHSHWSLQGECLSNFVHKKLAITCIIYYKF